ncbi:35811_t:CDS:2, partial [Gigaspora margarita]
MFWLCSIQIRPVTRSTSNKQLEIRIKELEADLRISNDANLKLIEDNKNLLLMNQNLNEQLQNLTDEEEKMKSKKANSILAIALKIRSDEPSKIQIEDLINKYNDNSDKQKFVKNLEKYVKLYDPTALMYFKKWFNTTYIRVATLHNIIGIHINSLPLPASWFNTRNNKVEGLESLIKYFKYGKE